MRKRDQAEEPTPLVELLEAANVGTPGALVDLLAERGDAVVVDALGRLAAPLPVAERLWAEQAERERIAAVEFERGEEERLAKLEAYVRQREEVQAEQARQAAILERQRRIESAAGIPLWQLEAAIRQSRTHAPGAGYTLVGKAMEDDRPVTLEEAEQYIRETYGAEVLEEKR